MDAPPLLQRGRTRVALALALAVAILGADASRAPDRQLTTRAAVAAVHAYQHRLSPTLARMGVRCRFQPTCSVYTEGALRKHGLLKGGWLGLKRIARCGPWTPLGTRDPVP